MRGDLEFAVPSFSFHETGGFVRGATKFVKCLIVGFFASSKASLRMNKLVTVHYPKVSERFQIELVLKAIVRR